jgi:hypothetical protein|uniref:Uncharacterized protein n=1 Tax=Mus musculus TaxID=10090 RepID=Q9CXP5_MOUSE|nr:unnamed protein product [Mus musculus]
MALGTVLRVCRAEPNPQGRVHGPALCDFTRLAMLEARRLQSWMLRRSSTGTQARGKSRARVTSLQVVSLLPHTATAKTPSLEGLVRGSGPAGITQHIVSGEECALQPYEALVIETRRLHLSKSRVLHEKLEPTEPVTQFWKITGSSGMSELGPKPPASFSVDTIVSAWIQLHLLYHCPIQGGLMRASCL